jgi:hypothetical protein
MLLKTDILIFQFDSVRTPYHRVVGGGWEGWGLELECARLCAWFAGDVVQICTLLVAMGCNIKPVLVIHVELTVWFIVHTCDIYIDCNLFCWFYTINKKYYTAGLLLYS